MKREKARLEELRAMPYDTYLQTPEWQETQRAALKRAGNRCQVCRSEGVALRVYHTTLDSLGCEQEGDVMALCEACYEHLATKLQRFAQQAAVDQADASGEEPVTPPFSLAKKALIFTPSALVLDGLFALLHAPLPAELFGVGVAIALAANSPRMYAALRESLPEEWQEYLDARAARKRDRVATGEWSTWDRLLGRHLYAGVPTSPIQITDVAGADQAEDLPGDELSFNFGAGKRLPACLDLAPDLRLAPGEIIGKSLFVAGQRRSGKTTLGALLAEQMGDQYIPLFIPDREGDYLSVYEHLPRGVIAGAPGSYDDQPNVTFWAVTLEDADVLGFQILYEGMQVILDLNTFELEEGFAIVNGVIKGLFAFARQYPDQLCPVEVYLDEAQRYLPQDLSTSWIKDAAIRDELLDLYRDLLTTGGKRGLTPVILSQRFAETNNKIMAQAELRFILRQTHDTDLDRCMKYVGKGSATREQIQAFAKGEGVFISDDGTQLVTRFNTRRSDGSRSHTPGAEAARRYMDMSLSLPQARPVLAPQLPSTPVPEARMAQRKTVSHSHAATGSQAARIRERERRLRGDSPHIALLKAQTGAPAQPEPGQALLPITDLTAYFKAEQRIPSLAEVIEAFPNQFPSKREIARRFDITEYQAYGLQKHLKTHLDQLAGRSDGRVDEERMATFEQK